MILHAKVGASIRLKVKRSKSKVIHVSFSIGKSDQGAKKKKHC